MQSSALTLFFVSLNKMSRITVKNTEIEFKNSGGTTGTQSIDTDGNIEFSRHLECSQGLSTSALTVSGTGLYSAHTNYSTIAADEFQLKDDQGTPAKITIKAPATVTAYSVTMPATQGSNSQILSNNGSGVLSWTDMGDGQKDYARMRLSGGDSSVNINSLRPLPFDTQDHANNITCNTSGGLFTVSRTGVYVLQFTFSGDHGTTSWAVYAAVNGTPALANLLASYDGDSDTDNLGSLSGSCILSLSASDTVGIWFAGISSTSAVSDSISISANGAFATIFRL